MGGRTSTARIGHITSYQARLKPYKGPRTYNTVDLAPRISFSLEAGLVTDCIAVEPDQGRPLFIKPIYSGNVLAGYQVPTGPAIVVCRPKSFNAAEKNHRSAGEVITMQALDQMPESGTKIVEQVFDDGRTGIPGTLVLGARISDGHILIKQQSCLRTKLRNETDGDAGWTNGS